MGQIKEISKGINPVALERVLKASAEVMKTVNRINLSIIIDNGVNGNVDHHVGELSIQ